MPIDSHAHVFHRGLPLKKGFRHAPQRDALLPELLALWDAHGISRGVLTAPSFLGTDNSHLLSALAEAPERLRGTVIVDPSFDRARLEAMDRSGVVGVRFNMLRVDDLPDLRSREWQRVLADLAALDWHAEIYVEGPRLPALLTPILDAGVKVVVDHFGSPDPALGVACPGFRSLLAGVRDGRAWVKLSAPYRLGGADPRPYAQALLEAGSDQLVWASDWPWTQHGDGMSYGKALGWLDDWVVDAAARARILDATPRKLFRFD
ncbi:MAG TPA: amidohydrolase family protein [Casimicrobiaceae bacterium]|nr:amidohydrolase family protein [Casimicrobiaceae bacterium]